MLNLLLIRFNTLFKTILNCKAIFFFLLYIKYIIWYINFSAIFHKKIIQNRTPKVLEESKSDLYTEAEKQVLLFTSKINNKEYVPFMDVDLLER